MGRKKDKKEIKEGFIFFKKRKRKGMWEDRKLENEGKLNAIKKKLKTGGERKIEEK